MRPGSGYLLPRGELDLYQNAESDPICEGVRLNDQEPFYQSP